MSLLDELKKRQMNGFAPAAPAPTAAPTPMAAPAPAVGPTIANAAALPQAPSPAGAMPELRDVFGNPMAMPSVPNVAPTPVDLVPSLSDPATRTRDLAGTGSGALIDTPSSGGFAGIEEGISEAVGAAPLGVATPAPSAPSPLADPNAGVSPTALSAPAESMPTPTGEVAPVATPAPAATPTPQAPQAGSGGLISFDTGARAGQTFFGDETGVGAVTQGNAAQIERGFDDTFGTRSAGDISITGPEGQAIDPNSTRYDPSRLTPTMQANVDAGRPPNVSAAQVQQAQTEAVARQATYEQGQAQDRIDRGMKKFMFDNRNATPEQQAKQQALLIAQENALRPEGGAGSSRSGIPGGDLSIRDQIALSKEGREQRGEQRELAEIDAEERQSYAKASSAAKSFVRQFENVSEIAADVKGQAAKPFTTGIGGMIMSLAAGTTASDMRANISTLQADSAFSALSAMRAASKTGGALGAISEGELKLLGDSQRALGADQSDEQLRKNVTEYVNLRNSLMQQAREAFAADYGQAKADEIFGGGSSEGSPGAIPNDRDSNTQVDAGLQQYFN